jgi:holliday junction DNA helicase RuvA
LITRISGTLASVGEDTLSLSIPPFDYEILIPDFTRRKVQGQVGQTISLHTLHYLDGNPAQGGRLTPRLVGFLTEVEREFFELFCSVDGVGVKKTLRAMVRPVREVAALIEDQDSKGLSALPGIGPATAERVIAKLRRKVPKFALMVDRDTQHAADVPSDVVSTTYEVLRKLGHAEADARKRIEEALATKQKFKDVDSLLHVIYQQERGG